MNQHRVARDTWWVPDVKRSNRVEVPGGITSNQNVVEKRDLWLDFCALEAGSDQLNSCRSDPLFRLKSDSNHSMTGESGLEKNNKSSKLLDFDYTKLSEA